MLTLDLAEFAFELKDGALKHVGASNQSATAKLYDVTDAEVRAYGNDRAKLGFADDEGNEVAVALDAPAARDVAAGLERLREDGDVFE
jgi:hypothetical protein